MGVLDKIEAKLSHKPKDDQPLTSSSERKSLERQAERQGAGRDGYGNTTSSTGYGSNTGNTGYGNSVGVGHQGTSRGEELRHPVSAANQRSDGYGDQYGSSTGRQQGYDNDGYSQQSSGYKASAVDPQDPRSIRGQQNLANASQDQGYGDSGRGYAGDDRSRAGGSVNGQNEHAIPTAGGSKVGSGGYGNERDQHHYGRDAGLAGGAAAAAGLGEREHRHHKEDRMRDDRDFGRGGQSGPGVSSADAYGGQSSTYDRGNDGYGVATGNESKHHGHHGHHSREGGVTGSQGIPTEKKVAGAYEAGYRDAMAHMEGRTN